MSHRISSECIDNKNIMFEYTGVDCSVPKDITSVQIKEGVQKIGDRAFYNCRSLDSITLPSTVIDIGNDAFNGCSNLREVILNDGLKKIGEQAFYNCSSLESIKLPSTLVEIGSDAFESCSDLREVIERWRLGAVHFTSAHWKVSNCHLL